MRGLPMDFPGDPAVRDLSDQWMFGPALMPCPVYEYKARSREVYFPEGGWYDFYTGDFVRGQQTLTVKAPYERMPLYVRAGSVIPFGPDIQHTDEKPAELIHLYVYAGADSDFSLYEDDGLTYGYEKGGYARIPIHWEDASRTLTIGDREGSFPGMLEERRFTVTVVDPTQPCASDPDAEGRELTYKGKSISLSY